MKLPPTGSLTGVSPNFFTLFLLIPWINGFKDVTAKLVSNKKLWEAFVQSASSSNAKSYPQWVKRNLLN